MKPYYKKDIKYQKRRLIRRFCLCKVIVFEKLLLFKTGFSLCKTHIYALICFVAIVVLALLLVAHKQLFKGGD